MIQSILSNIAIILLMHLLMSTLMNYRKRLTKYLIYILAVLIFSCAVITMFFLPIEFSGGYRVDLRLIPLIFLAYFHGWKLTLPVLIIVSLFRLSLGGVGSEPGTLFGMIGPTLLVLFFYNKNKIHGHYFRKILLITGCWFISDAPIIYIVPDGLYIFKEIFILRYSSIIGAAMILYAFITLEHKRDILKNQTEFLAWHDPLTKLLNKKKFIEIVEMKSSNSNVNHFLAMMDVDHFKRLNDTFGHVVGDQILENLSLILKKYENDHVNVGRYGGEEFILYLGHTSFEQSIQTLENIRLEINKTSFQINHDHSIQITVSIGVAPIKNKDQLQEAIKQADKNLYIAKENGRNQVTPYSDHIQYVTL